MIDTRENYKIISTWTWIRYYCVFAVLYSTISICRSSLIDTMDVVCLAVNVCCFLFSGYMRRQMVEFTKKIEAFNTREAGAYDEN